MRNVPDAQRHTWAAYVTAIREATGISRAELARRLDVDPTTVWRWETGRQKPESPVVPKALAELFDLDLDEALGAAGLKPDAAPPRRPIPALELEPDLELVARRLIDPTVSIEEKTMIRATLRYLAELAERTPPRKRQSRKKSA